MTRPTTSPPRCAVLDAVSAIVVACLALSALWLTVEVSSSMLAAVSSRDAACSFRIIDGEQNQHRDKAVPRPFRGAAVYHHRLMRDRWLKGCENLISEDTSNEIVDIFHDLPAPR
jgi:hypothetical protein